MPLPQDQRQCARSLIPLLAWICVALSLRYGYYGNYRLVLGPNSSRLMKTNSLLVEQVQVKDEAKQGLFLYGFNEKPKLNLGTNWTVSSHLYVDAYNRQGFYIWLNKGSRIWMAWEVAYGGGSFKDMLVVLIKGEVDLDELQRYYTSSHIVLSNSRDGSRAEYSIPDDDTYYLGVVNLTPQSIVMTMNVSVSSTMYDTSKATSICSTDYGVCKLKLLFSRTQYYVISTPNSDVPIRIWNVELSFEARLIIYFLITLFVVVVVYVILKHLGACDYEQTREEQVHAETETAPILPRKEMPCIYGTNEEPETSLYSSSEDLHDGKICVICYDERRNCFFIPCGHSATCYTCARRIMEEETKVCPICRRLIHKPKRLVIPEDGNGMNQ